MAGLRLDKWLWAARFFKTRSLATHAIDLGRIQLNGQRCKPAREVHIGDLLQIESGEQHWEVRVQNLSDRRGPAPEARLLYEETPESLLARQTVKESRSYAQDPAAQIHGRPTKRERRQLGRWREG